MNKKFVLLAFAFVFLLSAVIGAQLIVAVAAQRTVGVSVGDWAEYDGTFSGNATMPEWNITWAKITVQEISGTNITYETRVLYGNGTEETNIYVLDVGAGQGNGSNSGTFIAANLNEGDLVYTSPPSGPFLGATINETISKTYPVGNVQVNHLNITQSYSVPGYYMYNMSANYYWYKSTGMLTEMSMYVLYQPVEGYPTWYSVEVVITDVIPEFPPGLILPLFMIVTLTAVLLGKIIWSNKKSIKKPSLCA